MRWFRIRLGKPRRHPGKCRHAHGMALKDFALPPCHHPVRPNASYENKNPPSGIPPMTFSLLDFRWNPVKPKGVCEIIASFTSRGLVATRSRFQLTAKSAWYMSLLHHTVETILCRLPFVGRRGRSGISDQDLWHNSPSEFVAGSTVTRVPAASSWPSSSTEILC